MLKKLFIPLLLFMSSCAINNANYSIDYSLKVDFSKNELRNKKELTRQEKDSMLSDVKRVLQNRLQGYGASNVAVAIRDGDTIALYADILQTPESVKRHLFAGGMLEFKIVDDYYSKRAYDVFYKTHIMLEDLMNEPTLKGHVHFSV